MPVEAVELVERHNVEHTQNLLLVEEVACHVHHKSAVFVLGLVGDAQQGNVPLDVAAQLLAEELAGKQLLQCLYRIEESCLARCLNPDAVFLNLECVALGRLCLVDSQPYLAVGSSSGALLYLQVNACCLLYHIGEFCYIALYLGIGVGDCIQCRQCDAAFAHLELRGVGDYRNLSLGLELACLVELHGVVLVVLVP